MESRRVIDFEGQERAFRDTLYNILEEAKKKDIVMRALGAIAFRIHCPGKRYRDIWYSLGRVLTDLDVVAYSKDSKHIERLFADMNYLEEKRPPSVAAALRRIFILPDKPEFRVEVFFDKLQMCHDINFVGRLEIDFPTIPLVDLLQEKMQIIEINEKDIIDTIILIREHDIGDKDKEMINVDYLSSLCVNDWGLWKTITMNLQKVKNLLPTYNVLNEEDRKDVENKIDKILKTVNERPKSFKWRMRASIGEKQRWYREVEERIR